MEIEERFSIEAPIQDVWDYLVANPENLISCVPGCEKIERVNENTYKSLIKAKVGPVAVKFDFETTLVEVAPPKHLKAKGRGAAKGIAGKLGEFHHETMVEFNEVSHTKTEVHYKTTISITGKLATFGSKILKAKAEETGQKFVNSVKEKLEKEG